MTPLLHVKILGELPTWERVKWGRHGAFDGQKREKKAFQWQVKAASPMLKASAARLAMILEIWTKKSAVKTGGDFDNWLKFVGDAGNGLIWLDDSQIDDARVIIHRKSVGPKIELLVWEMP
jgi:Holliday junction resolvase RusA-like endonuclease